MNPSEPKRDVRPWGEELWLTSVGKAPSMVKIITVKPGEALSLQYHTNRDEHWTIISGDGVAEIAAEKMELKAGVTCIVPRMTHHRVTGGRTELTFVELAFGDFDEADIVRLEDRYGR